MGPPQLGALIGILFSPLGALGSELPRRLFVSVSTSELPAGRTSAARERDTLIVNGIPFALYVISAPALLFSGGALRKRSPQ